MKLKRLPLDFQIVNQLLHYFFRHLSEAFVKEDLSDYVSMLLFEISQKICLEQLLLPVQDVVHQLSLEIAEFLGEGVEIDTSVSKEVS